MKNKIISLLAILIVSFYGCNDEDYLEMTPIDFLAPDNFQSEKDIREAVNGIYRSYADIEEPIYTDFIVDNGFWVTYSDMWNLVYNSETEQVNKKWNRNYEVILRANTVLYYIDNVTLNEDIYNQHKGEAKFLRALCYFDLAELYGDVPLRTLPESLAEADKALTPKQEIVEFVLSELEEAAKLLPESYSTKDRGRATKGAALAIKARTLLFNKRYVEAAEYCQKVKDLGIYSIMDSYQLLFLPEGEASNTEVIFDVQFEKDANQQGLSNQWYTRLVKWSGLEVLQNLEEQYYSTNGLSINHPENMLFDESVNSNIYNKNWIIGDIDGYSTFMSADLRTFNYDNRFKNRDPRLYYTLVIPYSIYDFDKTTNLPTPYYPSSKAGTNNTSLRVRKYVDYSDNQVNNISGVNPVIIRYADILLMEAEALVESGTYDESYVSSLINEVRQRPTVMMPKVEDVEGTGLSQDELRQIIRHERRVEFAFEGLRIYDIKRWEIGEEAYSHAFGYRASKLKASSAVYEKFLYQERIFNPSMGYEWPIPKAELDANKLIGN